jgi:hypothetical protein
MGNKEATIFNSKTDPARELSTRDRTEAYLQSGFRVRLDLRAGDWRCTSCSGNTMGSNLFKPQCDYCEKI